MYKREWNKITSEQRKIIEKYRGDNRVKLGAMADDLGVKVIVSTMKTGISGQICKEGDQHVIRVNRYETRERQRFTIAHELAHFLLHRRLIDATPDGIKDNILYRSGAPENIEFEANRLAADLLMPKMLIEIRLAEFEGQMSEEVIEDMALSFQVSKAAMEVRLTSFYVAA